MGWEMELCKAGKYRNVILGTQFIYTIYLLYVCCIPFLNTSFHRPLKNLSGDGLVGQNSMFVQANKTVFC